MVKKAFVVTLLASVCFLGNFPLSAMEDENLDKKTSTGRTPHVLIDGLKIEEDQSHSMTIEEAIDLIDKALQKTIDEYQVKLNSFSEIKSLYVRGKRDEARQEFLKMIGYPKPKKEQKNRVVLLEKQIEYISTFYEITRTLALDFKAKLFGVREEKFIYPRDEFGGYLIHFDINTLVDSVNNS
ncbi:MAG TPA: hypothetical protein VMW10_00235, partial [Alphaproteobacteria bacterium]|nr:hypothetical protein [Alphaproteobacteria bacterium]